MKGCAKFEDGTLAFWSVGDKELYIDYDNHVEFAAKAKPAEINTFLSYLHANSYPLSRVRLIDREALDAVALAASLPLAKHEREHFFQGLLRGGASALRTITDHLEAKERILAMRLEEASPEARRFLELAHRQGPHVVEHHSVYLKEVPAGLDEARFLALDLPNRQLTLLLLHDGRVEAEECSFLMDFLASYPGFGAITPLSAKTLLEYAEAAGARKLAKKVGKSYVGRTKFSSLPFQNHGIVALSFLALANKTSGPRLDEVADECHSAGLWSNTQIARYCMLTLEDPSLPASWKVSLLGV